MSWLLAMLAVLAYSTKAPLVDSGAFANNQHVHTMLEASYTLADLIKEVKHISAYWERVNKNGPMPQGEHYVGMGACWQWTRPAGTGGYGKMRIGRWHIAAHKVAYLLTYGEVPPDMVVAHLCDNKMCCNPEHLEACTPGKNTRDAVVRGQFPTGDRSGPRKHPERLWRGEKASAKQRLCSIRGDAHYMRACPEKVKRGEAHGRAVLTADEVLSIRQQYAEGIPVSVLAREASVNMPCIGKIIRRITWRHI